jgi:hypothetical protein
MGADSASDPLPTKPADAGGEDAVLPAASPPTPDFAGPPNQPDFDALKDSPPLPDAIPACCTVTIRQHVQYNPMMVCSACKNIIKCFVDERAYENYLKFCRSRRRPVLTGHVDHYMTIAFRSYDTYNR